MAVAYGGISCNHRDPGHRRSHGLTEADIEADIEWDDGIWEIEWNDTDIDINPGGVVLDADR